MERKRKKLNVGRIKKTIALLVPPMGVTLLTAWLFFDFSPAAIGLLGYLPFAVREAWKEQKQKEKWEINLAFKDALICLENSLLIGYSPENSLRETVKELKRLYDDSHPICLAFRKMVKQVELGLSMEQAFLEYGTESGIADIRQLAEVFSVVKRTGGNLGLVLRQTSGVLQGKIELKRDLRTTIAAKRLEFQIMCLVPYGILLYLKLCAPSMCEPLYHSGVGIVFMWVVFLVYLGTKFWGERIIRGEIGKIEGSGT